MTLKYKILGSFMLLGIIPAAIIAFCAMYIASHRIEQQVYDQLTSIREIKKAQLQGYFEQVKNDLSLVNNVWSNSLKLETALTPAALASFEHAFFKSFIDEYHYYDLFIISPAGEVFYSVEKEADYQSNLREGLYKNSGLGRVFREALMTQQLAVEDFSAYAPSHGDPASFIAKPIKVNGQVVGVIALQLSIERVNQIMQLREGMGETGETYLVGHDFRMRSDSFLDPVSRSVVASFAGNIRDNGAKTDAVIAGLNGEVNTTQELDYFDHKVLSSYTPIDFFGHRWVLLAEMDEAEAFAALRDLQMIIAIVIALSIIGIVVVAFIIANSILKPIGGEPAEMERLTHKVAQGDLTTKLSQHTDHTGVYAAMGVMTQNLTRMIGSLSHVTTQLSSAAEQTSCTSVQASSSLQEQQASVETVSSAMYEMSETIESVSVNAHSVADLSQSAAGSSERANSSISHTIEQLHALVTEVSAATELIAEIESKSQGIGSILEVIRSISDQTNLLALNAAIEAARAGEQGRGFAVVADEVRQLAQKTQLSTSDIEQMIAQLQLDTQHAVAVMKKSSESTQKTIKAAGSSQQSIQFAVEEMSNISANAAQIATATGQQSLAAQEISQSITAINDTAAQNAVGSAQIAAASEHIEQLSQQLSALTAEFKLND